MTARLLISKGESGMAARMYPEGNGGNDLKQVMFSFFCSNQPKLFRLLVWEAIFCGYVTIMKTATAIKTFMNRPGNDPNMNYPDVKMAELREFKDACTPQEWAAFGQQACDAIGETFDI